MENEEINGTEVETQKFDQAVEEVKEHLNTAPSRDQVRQWIERDINTAIYALSAVAKFPDLLDKMADEMYEHAQKTPAQIMEEQSKRFAKDGGRK